MKTQNEKEIDVLMARIQNLVNEFELTSMGEKTKVHANVFVDAPELLAVQITSKCFSKHEQLGLIETAKQQVIERYQKME